MIPILQEPLPSYDGAVNTRCLQRTDVFLGVVVCIPSAMTKSATITAATKGNVATRLSSPMVQGVSAVH
jgi:hypothetical protein